MITIKQNQFKMTLPNGWIVSIVNHGSAACYRVDEDTSTNAEVWAWHSVADDVFCDVRGNLSPAEVAAYIVELSAFPDPSL